MCGEQGNEGLLQRDRRADRNDNSNSVAPRTIHAQPHASRGSRFTSQASLLRLRLPSFFFAGSGVSTEGAAGTGAAA